MYYSQDGQDKYLEENIFKGFKNGVFVDVGAHDGLTFNNTIYFEKNNNWPGINIEPINSVYNKLIINRPACININCAIDINDDYVEFLCNSGHTEMLSGIVSQFDKRHLYRIYDENIRHNGTYKIIKIETKKLDSILKKNNINHIHYLSIDVEGAEFNVIKSIDFNNTFIDIIGFENNYSDKSIEIVHYLENIGYKFLKLDIHDIFMIHKKSQFMQ
jgi:FkbM family methyltransferase